ncbi:MAG: hypothetical protein DRP25_01515, partial [Thermotoga sp.]
MRPKNADVPCENDGNGGYVVLEKKPEIASELLGFHRGVFAQIVSFLKGCVESVFEGIPLVDLLEHEANT